MTSEIYCCGCRRTVSARLTNGGEVYSHRIDLADVPFWKCDACGYHVGCHWKRAINNTEPLGCIPTPDISRLRSQIHEVLDTLWVNNVERRKIYSRLTEVLGRQYHTGDIRSGTEGRAILAEVWRLRESA